MDPNKTTRQELDVDDLDPVVLGAVSRPQRDGDDELEVVTGHTIGRYSDNPGGTGQKLNSD